MEETFIMVSTIAVGAILLSASIFDWKYREIPDIHWALMFIIGITLSVLNVIEADTGAAGFLMPACIVLIAIDCLYDRDSTASMDILIYLGIAITATAPTLLLDGNLVRSFISIPVIYVVMNILYLTGIVRGGADAKAIIAIATVFPTYPEIFGLPIVDVPDGIISEFFVPAFAVLTMALIITMLYAVYNMAYNIAAGNRRVPQMFLGTVMPIEKARTSKVWPMEDVMNGECVILTHANDDERAWDRLSETGKKNIWVTTIIPFIIPITIAYVLMVTIGFPLFSI